MNTTFSHTKNIVFTVIAMAWIFAPSALFAQTVPAGGTFVVTTQPVSDVSPSWATLNGYAAHESASVSLWFEWGETPSFGKVTQSRMRWEKDTASTPISGLTSGVRYYYRAVAISAGETVYGSTLSFVAGKDGVSQGVENITAVTERPENIFDTSATLRGFATGEDGTTERWFEYGETASFGNKTPVSTIINGYGTFNYSATGLRANTVYFYRAAAHGANRQTVYGVTVSFRTGNAPGVIGVYLGEGAAVSAATPTISTAGYKQTASVVSATKKTTTTTVNKKIDAVDCATTTPAVGSTDGTSSGLGADASSSGVPGSILVILAIMVAVLGAVAAAMHTMTLREEARRRESTQKMIIA